MNEKKTICQLSLGGKLDAGTVANWCNKTSRCIDYDAVFYNKLNSVA
jgi:hypothetical protein